ncbi:MFS transporter [Ilumatobacter sp.]|uniref:MFS transporter n=1 Tax=Ilumatobacter sp. TaxID=1967498 RepID=UPI003B5175DD
MSTAASRRALGPTTILFIGLALLMVGNGLNGAVIGVRSATEGFSVLVAGIVMAGYFAGFLLAPSAIVPRIPTVGHIRVFAGLASTASSAVLVHSISSDPVVWTLMRFVFGFCMAGLYVVIESWLSGITDSTNRGRTMAVYMIVSTGGLGVGQFLIAVADPNGFRLFVLSSVLVSMSLVPITLASATAAPVVTTPSKVSVRDLLGYVPTGVVGSFATGVTAGVLLGLGAVYATAIGLSLQRTAFFLIAPTIGAIVLQLPIGRLSDRVPRRTVLFGVAIAGAGVCASLLIVPERSVLVPLLMVGLGGTLYPLYSLVVSYALDWTPPGSEVGASGTLIRINGAGALTGPLVTAPLMTAFGAKWFFWVLSVAFLAVVLYVGWRMVVAEAIPLADQRAYVPFPARAGAMAVHMVMNPVRTAGKLAVRKTVTTRRHAHADARSRDVARHPSSFDVPARPTGGSGRSAPGPADDE